LPPRYFHHLNNIIGYLQETIFKYKTLLCTYRYDILQKSQKKHIYVTFGGAEAYKAGFKRSMTDMEEENQWRKETWALYQ